jgi:hypothetical protein
MSFFLSLSYSNPFTGIYINILKNLLRKFLAYGLGYFLQNHVTIPQITPGPRAQ